MKLFAYAIRDKKVEAFMPVFYVRAKGEAIRHFMDACSDKNSPFSKHPGDYELFELASYDDVSGVHESRVDRVLSGLEASAASVPSREVG